MITSDMTLFEIEHSSVEMERLAPWFFRWSDVPLYPLKVKNRVGKNVDALVSGLNRLEARMQEGDQVLFPIYTPEEIEESPDKGETQLIYMPGKPGMPFVLVLPGGGLRNAVVFAEGFPYGQRLNELGYQVFILVYRVGQVGLMPKPLEDLNQALTVIEEIGPSLGVNTQSYALCGSSAGGYLAACWGTAHLGSRAWGKNAPEYLFLAYPATELSCFLSEEQEKEEGCCHVPVIWQDNQLTLRLPGMAYAACGFPATEEKLASLSPNRNVDSDYPPVYMTHCVGDRLVPYETAQQFARELEAKGVPCVLRTSQESRHAYSLGIGMDVEGWLDDAVALWQSTRKEEK